VILTLIFCLVLIWVVSLNISFFVLKKGALGKLNIRVNDLKESGTSDEEIVDYIKVHSYKHFLGFLVLGPFALIKENRIKICPECFG